MSDRAKRPSFQWYPGDHRRDTAVQACSFEARGLWREMLDFMHDGEPYGHLTAGGVPIDAVQLARIVGAPVAKVRAWLGELEKRKVFSRTPAGVIYSRRMERDERIRRIRGEAGKKGGNPALLGNRKLAAEDNPEGSVLVNQTDKQTPTPAVAVGSLQSAVAGEESSSTTTTTSAAERIASDLQTLQRALTPAQFAELETLLATVPNRPLWVGALAESLSNSPVTSAVLARAVRDYIGNGESKKPNLGRFRGYLAKTVAEVSERAGGSAGPRGSRRAAAATRPTPQTFEYQTSREKPRWQD
jgi:hypothetical protein